jgi:putative hemolysin
MRAELLPPLPPGRAKAFVAFALWLASCCGALAQSQLANPASQRCAEHGGTVQIERRPDGGQYGVCIFTENRQCEEWAMFRGDCPAGGLRVTGYLTSAARFCAITGGRYDDAGAACVLPGGKSCSVEAYWAGTCRRPD